MGRSIQWTEDMRTTLMLLRTQTGFKEDKIKATAIFNSIFANELKDNGYRNGMEHKRLVDAWNSRHMEGRSRAWLTVDDPPKDAKQRKHRQRLLKEIRRVAAEIYGEEDKEASGNVTSEDELQQSAGEAAVKPTRSTRKSNGWLTDVVETDNNDFTEEQSTGDSLTNHLSTEANYETTNKEQTVEEYNSDHPTEAVRTHISKGTMRSKLRLTSRAMASNEHSSNTGSSRDGATEEEVSDGPPTVVKSTTTAASDVPPPLEMIHAFDKEAATKNGTPLTISAFMSHDNPVYELGGRVYSVSIDGGLKDVMVCNRNRCRRCNKRTVDPNLLGKAASRTQGLPFVHVNEKESIRGVGFRFVQEHREYNNKYPDDMWKTKVTFSDGVKREAMMCVWKKCELCIGKEAVREDKARYERMKEMQRALPSIEGEEF